MGKWWSIPILRFTLLGLVLWLSEHYIEWQSSFRIESPSEEILEISYQEWAQRSGSYPNSQQRAEIRQLELADSILFAEALRRELYLGDPVVIQRLLKNAEFLGIAGDDAQKIATAMSLDLHKNDELIRRRLVQRVEAIGRAQAYPINQLDEGVLHARYVEQRERWKIAPRFEISHIFFSADKPGIMKRVGEAQAQLSQKDLADHEAIALGDSFLMGNSLSLMEPRKIRDIFGDEFTESLMTMVETDQNSLNFGKWSAPLSSPYGIHLVKVIDFEKPTYRDFEEVKAVLIDDYVREQEGVALDHYLVKLRNKYEVQES